MRFALLSGGLVAAVLALAAGPGPGQPPVEVKPLPVPLLKLAPQAAGKAPRALRYQLLPGPLDLVPGNAAPLWVRAGQAARNSPHKTSDKEHAWGNAAEVKLDDLPRKQVRAFLDHYRAALRIADKAARRTRCDWEREPFLYQHIQEGLPLDEVQAMRLIASLLTIRSRLELAERRYEDAAHTLQTGFALARHLGGSDLLIQDLVALAVSSIMLARVEEWAQVPGSPNLYWALTDLPRPLVSVRHAIQSELNTLYRSFPQLREMKKKTLGAREAQALAESMLKAFHGSAGLVREGDVPPSPWLGKLGITALVVKTYPDAKRYFLKQGRTAKELEAMPSVQVVVLYFLDRYDRVSDDAMKWLSVPAWQGLSQMEKLEKQVRAQAKTDGNPIVAMLVPAITRVYAAQVRLERQIAGMRGAEALRAHAAANGGKAPGKWADITEVPLPSDPVTGKGLDAFYRAEAGKGVLAVPASPGMPAHVGRRYELADKKEEKKP